jgi:phytoene dehydrogenase-like protein
MVMNHDIIVIGGGHNGLVAAATLQKAGRRVLLLERREKLGGIAAALEIHPGYRLPGLLHETSAFRRAVIDELSLHRSGLALLEREPPVLAAAREGKGTLLPRGKAFASAAVDGVSEDDARGYADLMSFLSRAGEALRPVFSAAPPDFDRPSAGEIFSLLRTGIGIRRLGKKDLPELLRAAPMPVADLVRERVEDERLQAAIAVPALRGSFLGPYSPWSAFPLFYQAAGHEHGGVQGGGAAVVDALTRAALALGVTVRTGARVERIEIRRGEATGVRLDSGESFGARRVVATCDPRTVFLDLVDPVEVPPSLTGEAERYRGRGTTAMVHLALSGALEIAGRPGTPFERARICDSLEEAERAFDACKGRRLPAAPLLEVWVPTVSDPTLAPPGHHVVSIIVHFVPHDLEGGWRDEKRDELRKIVLDRLSLYAPGVLDRIVGASCLTPRDLEDVYGLRNGHPDHGEHAVDQLLLFRPFASCGHYATPIRGLYLGGSGSHPGGGITGAPGLLAARAVLAG